MTRESPGPTNSISFGTRTENSLGEMREIGVRKNIELTMKRLREPIEDGG
jgi:hypothetical protein